MVGKMTKVTAYLLQLGHLLKFRQMVHQNPKSNAVPSLAVDVSK